MLRSGSDTDNEIYYPENMKEVYALSQTPQVSLDHQVYNRNGKYVFVWDYVSQLYDEKEIMNCFDRDYEIFCGWSCDCPFFLCFSWVFGHKVYLNCRTNVYFLWRCTTINELMINEQVRDREVRVISSDGEQLGIMSSKEAMKLAREAELDLVKIAPNAKPPVCKIIDYGKYRYELALSLIHI